MAIARISGGRFSHAALCTDDSTIFESPGDVIQFSRLPPVGRAEIDGQLVMLRTLPGDPVDIELFRHPELARIGPEEFDEALLQEVDASHGADYSQMIRLASAVDGWRRPLAEIVLDLMDVYYGIDDTRGPFCSELVARVFQRMGLALFDTERQPDETSPNHLSVSKLCVVEGAIVRVPPEIIQPAKSEVAFSNLSQTQKDLTAEAMNGIRKTDALGKQIAEGAKRAQSLSKRLLAEIEQSFIHFSALLLMIAKDPIVTASGMIRKWVQGRIREGWCLAPAMHDLTTNELVGDDIIKETLASLQLFQCGVLRCKTLVTSAKDRARLKECRESHLLFFRWVFRCRRLKRVRIARKIILDSGVMALGLSTKST